MPLTRTDIPDRIKAQIYDLISPHLDIGDSQVLKQAYIDGIEATQSIQYYKSSEHLTRRSTQGRDNALVLAANKPAWVRTYVRTNRFTPVAALSGTLTVERRSRGFLWNNVMTLSTPSPGSVTATPLADYNTERSSVFYTINFIIPANECAGILRLTVRLTDASGAEVDRSSTIVHATLKQTLRLRGILIGYNGPSNSVMTPGAPPPPNINLPAPTIAGLQSTAARALLAMPVQSTGNFAMASQITFNLPLDDARTGAGACSVNWNTLLTRLATERTNDGNRSDVVYYGLLPAGMPIGVPGCGVDGVGAGLVGDAATLLHEIGHGYGFAHTPCGAAGTTDSEYPDYKPYPPASIGEYGIDITNGAIFPPATTSDYMSYCGPQWISLYQYARLVGHERLDPSWISDDPIWQQYLPGRRFALPPDIPDPLHDPDPWRHQRHRLQPLISIIGQVNLNNEIEVTSVARIMAEPTAPGPSLEREARLLDANGRMLSRAPLHILTLQGACCGGCDDQSCHGEPPYLFQALLPDVEPGYRLVIATDDAEHWERVSRGDASHVELQVEVHDSVLRLQWATDADSELAEAWVQWSIPDSDVWHGLATGLTERYAEIDLSPVPAGVALIRVLAHDGFNTIQSDPVPIDVARRPPVAVIMTPSENQVFHAGNPMRLWGNVTDTAGSTMSDGDESCWLIDGREVARGSDVWTTAPAAGEHRATLIARVDGVEARATARFTTVDGYRDGCVC